MEKILKKSEKYLKNFLLNYYIFQGKWSKKWQKVLKMPKNGLFSHVFGIISKVRGDFFEKTLSLYMRFFKEKKGMKKKYLSPKQKGGFTNGRSQYFFRFV